MNLHGWRNRGRYTRRFVGAVKDGVPEVSVTEEGAGDLLRWRETDQLQLHLMGEN